MNTKTLLTLLGLLCFSLPLSARLLSLQTQGYQGTATVEDATVWEYNAASIELTVLDSTGAGRSDLAPERHTGDLRSVIELPEGWTLTTTIVPAHGCLLKPTHLYNAGGGFYSLSLMAGTGGGCAWLAGDYGYLIRISTDGWSGVALGKITIKPSQ